MQAGRRVVGAPEHVEHLDEIVRCLVRRDLPDVEQVRPAFALLAARQELEPVRAIGLVALGLHVDQQRDDGGPLVAQRAQLGLVEGGVGDGEAALGSEARQLGAAECDLVGHRGLPVAQEVGRSDVVVVHQLGLGPRRQDVVDGAADGRLIQQPAVTAGSTELDDGLALGLHVLGVAAVEDVRVDAGGAQPVPQVQRVHADGVTAGEGRNDLVDPHGRAVYSARARTPIAAPMHQMAQVAPVAWSRSCWSELLCARPRPPLVARPLAAFGALFLSLAFAVPTALLGLASPAAAADLNAPDRASVPALRPHARVGRPARRRHQREHRHDRERRPRCHCGGVGGRGVGAGRARRGGRAVPPDRRGAGKSTPAQGAPARGPRC